MRAAFLLLVALSSSALAKAQSATQADRPLATFSPADLERIAPLLESGTVSLVEFAGEGEIPAVITATYVDARPEEVAAVIGDPSRYPEFMPALDRVDIGERSGLSQAYAWVWQASVFTFRGDNAMQTFAPPSNRPEVGYRFVSRSIGGDLGVGRTVWRILPRGARGSLLMTSSRMDLRDANYLTRQLASAGQSINRTVHITIGMAILLRTRMEAERRAGHVRSAIEAQPSDPERPPIQAAQVEPLLHRGDVVWMETSGADLGRLAVLGLVPADVPTVRRAMLDPMGFTHGLLQGARASEEHRDENGTRFSWAIELPLVGNHGVMHVGESSSGRVHLDGVEGALSSARFRFETEPVPVGTLVSAWGRFDPAEGFWMIRAITQADGAFAPGLAGATQLMMMRGLRTRILRGI